MEPFKGCCGTLDENHLSKYTFTAQHQFHWSQKEKSYSLQKNWAWVINLLYGLQFILL